MSGPETKQSMYEYLEQVGWCFWIIQNNVVFLIHSAVFPCQIPLIVVTLWHVCAISCLFHLKSHCLFCLPFRFPDRNDEKMNSAACARCLNAHTAPRACAHIYALSRVCVEKFSMRASKVREVCGAMDGCSEWTEGGGSSYINSCRLRGISSWWKPRRRNGCNRKFTDIFSFFFFLGKTHKLRMKPKRKPT